MAGAFVVVAGLLRAAQAEGLLDWLAPAVGTGTRPLDLLHLSGASAVAANLVNNLPAYLLVEPSAADDVRRLVATLVGVNAGALVTPWASLATLLWLQRCRSAGLQVPLLQARRMGRDVRGGLRDRGDAHHPLTTRDTGAVTITRDDVLAARDRIDGRVRRTPLLAPSAPTTVWLKCEFLQHCGVFKTRGAFNRQLAAIERGELGDAGIVVASGGNAGLAQAYAARELGVRATVFVPETAPVVKVERIRRYGADVRLAGTEYAEAQQAALEFAREAGAAYAHAYDQPEVAAGAGTLAEEVLDDEPGIDTVVVAVGGGGLYAGVAASVRGRARVVAVEPRRIPTLHGAIAAGRPRRRGGLRRRRRLAGSPPRRRPGARCGPARGPGVGAGGRRGHRRRPRPPLAALPHRLRARRRGSAGSAALGCLRAGSRRAGGGRGVRRQHRPHLAGVSRRLSRSPSTAPGGRGPARW